jgi:hypothetical protein
MSSLTEGLDQLVAMADAVGWEIRKGGKHNRLIISPHQTRPITIPDTPSSQRSVVNKAGELKRAGLNEAYERYLQDRKNESRETVATVRSKANQRIERINAEAGGSAPQTPLVAPNGGRMVPMEVTPEQAKAWLDATEAAEDFHNRPIKWKIVADYADWMKTGLWKPYVHDGVICIDPQGMLLNGQKRMHAVVEYGKPVGFWVAFDVPREQFAFMDIAQTRNSADTFAIAGLPSGPDIASAIRLAMLYEKMVRGDIERINWMTWRKSKFTNDEALAFYSRREEMSTLRELARQVYLRCGLNVASLIVFHFYADKAWPTRPRSRTNRDPLTGFLEQIRDGENMTRTVPAMALREWAITHRKALMDAKREVHLYLLFRAWEDTCIGRNANGRVYYQPTWPMLFPYHPDGNDHAITNLLKP